MLNIKFSIYFSSLIFLNSIHGSSVTVGCMKNTLEYEKALNKAVDFVYRKCSSSTGKADDYGMMEM